MAKDVSGEREAEQARQAIEERYRQIVDTTTEGTWAIDADNRTTFVNESMARMLQLSVAEMDGRSVSALCEPEELRKAEEAIDRCRVRGSERFELTLRRGDGTEMHALVNASALFDATDSYSGVVAMVTDVTERVEEQRLESVERPAQRGAGTILVVEDDAVVRAVVVAMLEECGYHVLAADGGDAALELAGAWPAEIDLILTDLAMHGRSGRETAEGVRALYPAIKVLYMSGDPDGVLTRGGASEPGAARIQKPFGMKDLDGRVREILEPNIT